MWKLKNRRPAYTVGAPAPDSIRGPSRKRRVWLWIERTCLLLGIALLAFYCGARIESLVSSRAALRAFNAAHSTTVTGGPEQRSGVAAQAVDFSAWDEHRVQEYKQSLAEPSGIPLAVLLIPRIHLEVPVFNGTDDLTLNRGVGRIIGTAQIGQRGNIGIAGHRDGFFRGLKDIAVGDTLVLKTPKGINTYVVDGLEVVSPKDVEVLRPRSVPSLTLVTCYPFYYIGSAPERYIVMASSTQKINGGRPGTTPTVQYQTSSSLRRQK